MTTPQLITVDNASQIMGLAVLEAHKDGTNGVMFSPDGATLASAGQDATVRLWNVMTGEALAFVGGHGEYARSVIFSPDGTTLATSGCEEIEARLCIRSTVRLWDIATGEERAILEITSGIIEGLAFRPDGIILASASVASDSNAVRLWDVEQSEEVDVLEGRNADVAFSPNGSLLASISNDDISVHLLDLESGNELAVLRGHEFGIGAVAFSPDGMLLVTGGNGPNCSIMGR